MTTSEREPFEAIAEDIVRRYPTEGSLTRIIADALQAAVAAEREWCAVECAGMDDDNRPEDFAAAIRARGANRHVSVGPVTL